MSKLNFKTDIAVPKYWKFVVTFVKIKNGENVRKGEFYQVLTKRILAKNNIRTSVFATQSFLFSSLLHFTIFSTQRKVRKIKKLHIKM